MAIINSFRKITLRSMMLAAGGLLLWVLASLATGSLCWFQSVLGVPCPGCGSMRAAEMLLQGRFAEAHVSHPLILLSAVLVMYFSIKHIFFPKAQALKFEKPILVGIAALYIAVFAIRLVFLFPHTEPLVPLETALWRQVLGFVSAFFY